MKKMRSEFPIVLFVVILLAWALTACGSQATPTPEAMTALPPEYVVAEGHIVPAQEVYLSFAVRGTVADILVSAGDSVEKGDVLIRLADKEQAEAALRAAQLELTSAQQAYDEFVRTGGLATADAWQAYLNAQIVRAQAGRKWEALNTDNIRDKIDDAEAKIKDRQEDLNDAQDTLDKYKDLDKDNPKRKNAEDDLEKAQEDYNEAVRKLEEAQREQDAVRAALDAALSAEAEAKRKYEAMAEAGLDPDQKALLDARLANAQAQVAAAENILANYELKAPFTGAVADINVKVGQLVGPETWAVQLADFKTWYVETSDLTELEVVKISEGQAVEIIPDALPDLVLSGTVENISQSFKAQAGDILYTVKIHLNDSDPRLRWGMTVEATFQPE
ncbi:MAG: HlyD family efflux transporter periplasmic adaptor subunit [Chloroflexi bacterium]|nr:HlyD family efflux transporter periplasmic adaptor subunit [Chloroflexota bacterium]